MTDIPDLPARLLGVREWRVFASQQAIDKLLGSVAPPGEPWRPGEEKVARCTKKLPCKGKAPNPKCECGLYAFYDYELYLRSRSHTNRSGRVAGVVSAAGEIEEHELGFRAERMRMEALLTSAFYGRKALREYAEVYNVPLLDPHELPDFVQSLNAAVLSQQLSPRRVIKSTMKWADLEEEVRVHLERVEALTGVEQRHVHQHLHLHPNEYEYLPFDGRDEIVGIRVVQDSTCPRGEWLFIRAKGDCCVSKSNDGGTIS